MQFELSLNFDYTGTPTQNGVVTVGNNETTPLRPDSLLGEFTKASESRISETTVLSNVIETKPTIVYNKNAHILKYILQKKVILLLSANVINMFS